MNQYKVISDFTDLKDGKRIYRVDDIYPHHNAPDPTEERIESLLTDKNKRKEPLIVFGENPAEVEEETTEEDAEDLNDLTVEELKQRLDEREIDYKSNDNKKTLVQLLNE